MNVYILSAWIPRPDADDDDGEYGTVGVFSSFAAALAATPTASEDWDMMDPGVWMLDSLDAIIEAFELDVAGSVFA